MIRREAAIPPATVDDEPTELPVIKRSRGCVLEPEEIAEAAARFAGRDQTMALLSWVIETFGDDYILATTWQHGVIIDHLSRLTDRVRVFEIDTELLFRETYETRQQLVERYNLDVLSMRSHLSVAEQAVEYGPNLWEREPDRCCKIRKVTPLRTILGRYDAWLTGLRREQSSTRRNAAAVEYDRKHDMVKVNPLAFWTTDDVWGYVLTHDVPFNPLLNAGYPSIGCFPCTAPAAGDDPRAGRWSGFGKTECGLHSGPNEG